MPWWADFDWGPTESGATGAPESYVVAFAATMPPRYRVLFDPRTIRKHAEISFRRAERPAHVEVWRTLADGSAALCVVADDRPGLLSAIAAALVSHRLDVITALVFSRSKRPASATSIHESTDAAHEEAVDLVWVRRADPGDHAPMDDDEAASIGQVLSAILSGQISVEEIASRNAAAHPPGENVVVRCDEVDEDGLAALFVAAPDRPGMLLTITHQVFQQGAQIVRSLVRTAGGRAFNHFELSEFSGAPLSAARRDQIRAAVYEALTLA
jgi:[protein-PII] uridylyltransferase